METNVELVQGIRPNIESGQANTNCVIALRSRWRKLCTRFVPIYGHDSIFRYSRERMHSDPMQGWKIHLPATLLSACDLLEAVGTFLKERGSIFKAPKSLDELIKINSGIFYGYSQVGKIVTVYPQTEDEFSYVVKELRAIIPDHIAAPAVPFDFRFGSTGIFYRYGAFVSKKGVVHDIVTAPDGTEMPDRRDLPPSVPSWQKDPLPGDRPLNRSLSTNPLTERYGVFNALSQRGKGGVYLAVDMRSPNRGPYIVKEGRQHGETSWDSSDGRSRVMNEKMVLSELKQSCPDVPEVYESFDLDGNFCLVLERIDGENLLEHLRRRRRRLSISRISRLGFQVADLLAGIHAAGWVWRDCKPTNLVLTKDNRIRPIDFEGACRIDESEAPFWLTPAFSRPAVEVSGDNGVSRTFDDIYALGILLYYLIEGNFPWTEDGESNGRRIPRHRSTESRLRCLPEFRRKNVPADLRNLIFELLQTGNQHLPAAAAIARRLAN